VRRYFFRERATGKIFFLQTGVVRPEALESLPESELAAMAEQQQIRARLEEAALPPGSTLATGTLGEIAGEKLSGEFLSNPSFLAAFFSTVSDRDYTPLVLKNLREILESQPGKWREYQNLAIALAVVNDSPLPEFWPHIQVTPSLVPKEIPSVSAQFSRWVAANESKKLDHDLRKLPPDQLKFVVDAFVTESEIDWARKNVRFSRSNFDRAFSEVAYQPDRIKNKRFFWKASPYTLENIRRTGGICVDQAYYAMIAGKAHGLPTLFFTGQGKDGGHAWFGYLKREDKWELDVGRYAQQNYAIGQALDPQSWQPISDHQLQLLAARFRDKPEFAASMNDLAMASIFEKNGDLARADAALASAVQTCPKNPDAWEQRAGAEARVSRGGHSPPRLQPRLESPPPIRPRQPPPRIRRPILRKQSRAGDHDPKPPRPHRPERRHRRAKSERRDRHRRPRRRCVRVPQTTPLDRRKRWRRFCETSRCAVSRSPDEERQKHTRRAIDTMRQQLSPDPGSLLDMALRELELSTKNRTKVP
jgi:hypothetical protein